MDDRKEVDEDFGRGEEQKVAPRNPEECLKIINSAIYLNRTGGDEGRRRRDAECDRWLLNYFGNCKEVTIAEAVKATIFSEVTTLFVEAIQSYRYGHFEAAMPMVRSSIDAMLFCIGERRLVWTNRGKGMYSIQPVNSSEWWTRAKTCKIEERKWKHGTLIEERGYLTSVEYKELKDLRQKGNFSAHLFVEKAKEWEKMRKMRQDARPKDSLQDIVDQMKQYTSPKEAKATIERAFDLIVRIEAAHVRYLLERE